MKPFFMTVSAVMIASNIACGSQDNGNKQNESSPSQDPTINKSGETGTPAGLGSTLVDTSKDLPACTPEKKGSLAYVKTEEKFYVCSEEWASVKINGQKGEKGEQGTPGANGLGITKIQTMREINQNYCTQFPSIENCKFLGGQVIRFADGKILATASWEYFAFSEMDSDSDIDISTKTIIIPDNLPFFSVTLHSLVARGDGYKDVFLVYSRELDKFALVYDQNESGKLEGSDQILSWIILDDN